jgi:hypothetical protein
MSEKPGGARFSLRRAFKPRSIPKSFGARAGLKPGAA